MCHALAELVQYERRFMELYDQVQRKFAETKQYFVKYARGMDVLTADCTLPTSIRFVPPPTTETGGNTDAFLLCVCVLHSFRIRMLPQFTTLRPYKMQKQP